MSRTSPALVHAASIFVATLLALALSAPLAAGAPEGDAARPSAPSAPEEADDPLDPSAAPGAPSAGKAPAKAAPKPSEAAVLKVKKALERAGEAEKRRAKAEAAGKAADAQAALEAREKALAESRASELRARFEGLARAATYSSPAEARVLASRELSAIRETACAGAIVRAFVRERERAVRVEHGRALAALADKDTAVWFVNRLVEKEPERRLRAMQGLAQFRDRRAVEPLIAFVEEIAGGFGGASAQFTTDRAYVSAWRLVSGGTGLTVVEVADPEVDIVREGVALEVKVRQVQMRFAVGLLQDLTGQSFGADPGAWRAWLAANRDFALAAARD